MAEGSGTGKKQEGEWVTLWVAVEGGPSTHVSSTIALARRKMENQPTAKMLQMQGGRMGDTVGHCSGMRTFDDSPEQPVGLVRRKKEDQLKAEVAQAGKEEEDCHVASLAICTLTEWG